MVVNDGARIGSEGGEGENDSALALKAAMQELAGLRETRERTEEMVKKMNLITQSIK